MGKWLSRGEYARIRNKAKKMGAVDTQFERIMHIVRFPRTTVSFAFYPLRYHVNIRYTNYFRGDFSTREEVDEIKRDMDVALEFIEYLKEFNAQLPIATEEERK